MAVEQHSFVIHLDDIEHDLIVFKDLEEHLWTSFQQL